MAVFEIHGGPITHRYLMNKSKHDLARMYMELMAARNRENEQRDRLIAALTPSADTKAAYMGDIYTRCSDPTSTYSSHPIDWDSVAAVMALIRKEAGL